MTRKELLQDIKDHPEKHRHDFEELQACCMDADGCFDTGVMEAHSSVGLGENAGRRCDVISGACACGAWH